LKYIVTLPEALPIAVITRFITWFKEFDMPVGGVVVNILIGKAPVAPGCSTFVRTRVDMRVLSVSKNRF